MNRGYIKLHRKLLESRIFQNEALLKVWIWCLLKAGHKGQWVSVKTGRGYTEVWVGPGEFLFGRHTAAKELKMKPTTVWYRILKLQALGAIVVKIDKQWSIISIVNWESYQGQAEEYDNQLTTIRQPTDTNKNVQEYIRNSTPDFASASSGSSSPSLEQLRERYPDQSLIDRVFRAIASTRKRGRVSESVLVAQLLKWERYPVEQVERGLRIYLEKDYASQGKREDYLLGIIRNQKVEFQGAPQPASTGSPLLDRYYARISSS